MAELKFKQIAVGQWDGGSGNSFTVVGLTEDGKVYKCLKDRWTPLGGTAVKSSSRSTASTSTVLSDDDIPF